MYRFEVNWNRKLAAKGWATAAFVHEMIRGAALGNFGRITCLKTGSNGAWPSLDAILALEADDELCGACEDETGRLSWSIVPVARPGEWNR